MKKSYRRSVSGALTALLLALVVAAPARAQDATFSNERLDQLLAPIALYPDSLLSQVLMACTYPAEVAEAVKWSKANQKQKGDAAVTAVESKGWDPSVASLVAFPQALAMMGERPDWVQLVGDAFLAQPEDVMDSVQRLRQRAQQAGNLKSNEQITVSTQPAPPPPPAESTTETTIIQQAAPAQTIVIAPANPQVIYVPAYNPTVVFGTWPYPSYPPYYWPTPGYAFGNALVSGIAFGTGIAITNAIWGGFDWGRRDVNINVNRFNNININRRLNVNNTNIKWQHNAINRKGVPYRDARTRAQFDKALAGADARKQFRGKDINRERAQAALKDRGVDPAKARETLKRDPQARERAQAAVKNVDRNKLKAATQNIDRNKARAAAQKVDRDKARAAMQNIDRGAARKAAQNRSRDNAFKGAGNAVKTRQQVDRGVASRQAMQQRPSMRPAKFNRPAAQQRPAMNRPAGHARPAARPAHRAGGGRAMHRGR
jgi:hypothetical protein